MDIVIDFDGTCVTHEFPNIGKEIGAAPVLRELERNGHQLILWTMRSDGQQNPGVLKEAIDWFIDNKIPLYSVNSNPTQNQWTKSPKQYAQLYIDDAALGCPLIYDSEISERPFADWDKIRNLLIQQGIVEGVTTSG